MKKLLTIIAVACMATLAQASAFNWTSTAYKSDLSASLNGGTYWLVSLGTSTETVKDLYVLKNGSTSWTSDMQVATGAIGESGMLSGKVDGLSAANNGTYYALIVWDGVVGGYYGVATSEVTGIVDASATTSPMDAMASFDNMGLGYGMILADKATVIVPEPTVLALLALGVAGLALKRKNA